MEWWTMPAAIPGAVDFGAGAVALMLAIAAAAVPGCVLLRRAPRRRDVPVAAARADETLRHAA
jgi:hypothetical protein